MGILNGEGYGRSIDERIESALDDAYPSKPGFSAGYEKSAARDAIRREFGLANYDDEMKSRPAKQSEPAKPISAGKYAKEREWLFNQLTEMKRLRHDDQ